MTNINDMINKAVTKEKALELAKEHYLENYAMSENEALSLAELYETAHEALREGDEERYKLLIEEEKRILESF